MLNRSMAALIAALALASCKETPPAETKGQATTPVTANARNESRATSAARNKEAPLGSGVCCNMRSSSNGSFTRRVY